MHSSIRPGGRGTTQSLAPLALVSALAAYGSLYPFRFVDPASFERALVAMFMEATWWTSRGDVAGNVLLFVPMGIAMVAAMGPARISGPRLACYIVYAVLFALALQVLQIYFPPRSAALSDVIWNATGTAIGVALGYFFRTHLARWSVGGDRLVHLTILGIALWVGWRLWPFVPTINWQNMKDAIKPLVQWPPLNVWSFAAAASSLALLAGVMPAFRHPQTILVAIALGSLCVRPFLVGQVLTIGLVAGTLLGTLVGLAVLRVGIMRAGPTLIAVIILWSSLDAMRPFEFSALMGAMHWLPFAAMLQGAMDINLASLCGAAFVTGALTIVGARLGFARGAWCAVLTIWVVTLEIMQLWIPTRSADITIGLLPIGWWWAVRFTERIEGG
ncbi:MAG: VanZ family protein [Burkholderiales bacterium]